MEENLVKTAAKGFCEGIAAGICITLGCAVFLGLPEQKALGAVLFAVALLCICFKGYNLYTGKIGLIVENHTKSDFTVLIAGLAGNVAGAVAGGLLLRAALPDTAAQAETVCAAKLGLSFLSVLLRGAFCGVLMYLAVSIFRENGTIAGILFCIPAFILSGFEHSIADICYFATAAEFSGEAALFLAAAAAGNTVGAMILPALKIIFVRREKTSEKD